MNSCSRLCFFAALMVMVEVLLAGCGGGGTSGAPAPAVVPTGPNEHRVYVDAGPVGTGYNANRLYTDVTICQPGNPANCQTIAHVLVDTGSTGLRILSNLLNPALGLRAISAPGGQPLLGCVQFVDNSFAWGPLALADVKLGAKAASSLPVQLIADPAYRNLASNCSSGTEITVPDTLGANGILGIGLFKEDCGATCESNPLNGSYYTCTSLSCATARGTTAPRNQQTQNPIPLFASDNNGVAIELPAVGTAPAPGLSGKMVFGIGSRPNTLPDPGRVMAADSRGNITTRFEGRNLARSFIDSGSNGLYFDTANLPLCAGASGFYCPPGLTSLTATMIGSNNTSIAVAFNVDHAVNSFAGSNPVLPNLAGTFGTAASFDWGLPFFYGRKVFFGIEGMPSPVGAGPFYAF
jgi:hypothetical protein